MGLIVTMLGFDVFVCSNSRIRSMGDADVSKTVLLFVSVFHNSAVNGQST